MLPDALHPAHHRARWGLLFRGLLALAIGILILVRPLESVAAFALVIAIWALVTGIGQVVDSIELRAVVRHWWLLLIGGLISIAFGVAALYYYPALSLAFAIIWVAYWLLLSGFVGIYIAMQERRIHVAWGWPLAFGILSVLAGVYAILVPPVTLIVLMGLIAGFALVGGVLLLIGFFRLSAAASPVASAAQPASP
jgi:uncharacterized membrane protein HdeD (DUF308 family)